MYKTIKTILPYLGKGGISRYITLGILSGVLSFLFINLITQVIKLIVSGEYKSISVEYMILFCAIILFLLWVRRTLASAIINLSQTLFWNLRRQVLKAVLKADYHRFREKKNEIYSSVVSDVNVLTNASMNIIEFSTSSLVTLACLVYLITISWILFLVTVGVAIAGALIYQLRSSRNTQDFTDARNLENSFVNHLNMILNGFKEIYMNPAKGNYILRDKIDKDANEAFHKNVSAHTGFLNNQIIGQVLFYVLIASILLVFSVKFDIETKKIVSYIFILLYLLTSIESIMVLLPTLTRAKIASDRLLKLKQELDQSGLKATVKRPALSKADFKQIAVNDLEFDYGKGEQSFSIGPVDLNIQKNDVIFIYGGNGSGKTTFIHTVLGLNKWSKGEIQLNGERITEENYGDYRSVFSVVFSDFYLFDELLIDSYDEAVFLHYLQLFEIDHKLIVNGKKFSTTDLSMGQRKRLALISLLMEEKPVLVLDEWAADQDPYFRKKFYTEIIPFLKMQGFTIVAITHDDKYYGCADKLYKMEFGKLMTEKLVDNMITI